MAVAIPSPISVRCRPGSSRKFWPTVAEMADMSPMCSIMVATEIGAMTRIAVRSNLQIWNGGRPMNLALATLEKSRIAEPSGLLRPVACMMAATA